MQRFVETFSYDKLKSDVQVETQIKQLTEKKASTGGSRLTLDSEYSYSEYGKFTKYGTCKLEGRQEPNPVNGSLLLITETAGSVIPGIGIVSAIAKFIK